MNTKKISNCYPFLFIGISVYLLLFCTPEVFAQAARPPFLKKAADIYENRQLTDMQVIKELSHILDELITDTKSSDSKKKESYARQSVILIKMIAERIYPQEPKSRLPAIKTYLIDMKKDGFKNYMAVRSYLYIAEAYAGGIPPNKILIDILKHKDTPNEIKMVILEAYLNSNVPIYALPVLITLSKNNWNVVQPQLDENTSPKKFYPIRSYSFKCLKKLGVKCELIEKKEKEIDSKWNIVFSTMAVKIDHSSIVELISKRLLSNDETVWKETANIVKELNDKSLWNAVENLKNEGQLDTKKWLYLKSNSSLK